MNAVFGKVARFIRIVQLKPFVEPVPDSLLRKTLQPSPKYKEALRGRTKCYSLYFRFDSGDVTSLDENESKSISQDKRGYERPMYYWSDADFVSNLV